ncbi:MAG: FAD binding domain-containing protein [Benniella sp.]|nr:MAG: FAD binding domain-containing protein [Benniella sp.]
MSNQVIVVGGGLSGLSAAHTVLEHGHSVLVIDKNSFFGGNSTKATSGINGALTKTQIQHGIKDSVEAFYEDTAKSARDMLRPDLVKVLTGRSASAVEWLQTKFQLDLSLVSRLGGHSFPRTHRGKEKFPGMTITYGLMEALEELSVAQPDRVKLIKKARVTNLIKENGAVVGVEYENVGTPGQKLQAWGPVVLATGGYAADFTSDSLLKKYRPDLWDLPTTNGDHTTGDGIKMAIAIGGKTINMEKVQVHPTGLVDPREPDAKVKFLAAEALRGVGGLLLQADGKRFCDELGHRDYVTGMMWKNKFPIRLVLNTAAAKEIEWHCKHYVGRGLMKHFKNGEALAKEIGIPPAELKKTFDEYNEIAAGRVKDPWGKRFFHNVPITMEQDFHVAHMSPVLHYTMGGVDINDRANIKDDSDKPIPGLFAAGEMCGGVHGANRLGGSSLLGCVVFGRTAGDSVSEYLKSNPVVGSGANKAQPIALPGGFTTTVSVDPNGQKINLEISWGGAAKAVAATAAAPAAAEEPKKLRSISAAEVAKHNKENDCWVIVNGQVLDVTNFLADHPGGKKAILIFAGKDATDEFNMLHKPDVVDKYAPETVIGVLDTNSLPPRPAKI